MPKIPPLVLQITRERNNLGKGGNEVSHLYVRQPKIPKIPAFVFQTRRKKTLKRGYLGVTPIMSEPQMPKIHAKKSKSAGIIGEI